MPDFEALLRLRERPPGRALMRQTWEHLTFLHAPVDPGVLQSLLPLGLTIETYPDSSGQERAWIGLVPFRMSGIRFEGFPAIPGTSSFAETNVRTYVTAQGRDPGVWFFSLDAANALACAVARKTYGLPYHHARMRVEISSTWRYASIRPAADAPILRTNRQGIVPSETWRCEVEAQPESEAEAFEATPGTFEFWLVERYLLYSQHRNKLHRGRVHHAPYRLRYATATVSQNLARAAGEAIDRFPSVLCSDGVSVEVFGVEPI